MAQYISNTTQFKNPLLSKTQNLSQYSGTAKKPVTWGIPNTPLSTQSAVKMGTAQTTPAIGKITPKATAPKTTSGTSYTGVAPTTATYTPTQTGGPAMTTTPTNYTAPTNTGTVKGIVPTPSGTGTSFGGLIQNIVGASGANKTQTGLVSDVTDSAKGNAQIGEDARAIAQKYADEIARVGKLGAGAVAGDLSTGSNVVGSGNAAIASQSASSRMSALSDSLTSELLGNQQRLTGQNQQTTGLNMALGGANTQQQQQLSGLSSAATYSQPTPAGYGQTVFDPTTGTYSGGSGGLDPQNVASQLANEVRSGRMTYEQAVASLGYAGGAGQQFLNNALGGGFNIPQSSATIAGQANVLGQLPAMESADIAAEGVKNKINTYLTQNPQLNPSALAASNTLQQWIQGKQLTDPKYQTLFNYLNEYTNTLAPILGVGGDPTNLKTEIAQSFINAAASGQSIQEVLENMQGLSRGKIQDIRSGATGGGVVSSPTGSGTGSGSLWDW